MILEKALKEVSQLISQQLVSRFDNYPNLAFKQLLKNTLNTKFAFDRAFMVKLGCEVVGGRWEDALHGMVAIELLDLSLIVVDDVFDKQNKRMQGQSILAKYGDNRSIILGIILKSMSIQELIEQCKVIKCDNSNILEVVEKAHHLIYLGQYEDIILEGIEIDTVTYERYLKMVELTTGAELSVACQVGGIIGQGNNLQLKALQEYGNQVGIIFQIRDDLIDYIDDEKLIGKTPFNDFYNRKKRLPLLAAYNVAGEKGKKAIKNMLKKDQIERKEITSILHMISDSSVIEEIKSIVKNHKLTANEALASLPENKSTQLMKEILQLGCSI